MVRRGNFQHVLRVEGLVESVSATNVMCPQSVDGFITYLIEDGAWVEEGDTLCVIEDTGLESDYESVLQRLEEAEGALAKMVAKHSMDLALLESQYLTNQAETKIAQLDSLRLAYLPAGQRKIEELELEIVALRRKKLEEKISITPMMQEREENRRNNEIRRLKRQVETLEERLAALVLLAPKKGIASIAESPYMREKFKVGDNVWNGMAIISIPDMEHMKVMIAASETDFKAINESDSVIFTFGAMPDEMAFGKITRKVRAGKPVKRGSKVKTFDIEASIDSTTRMPDPGYTVNCNVMLQEMRDTIFVPIITVFNEDSIKVVYVRGRKGFEMRQVLTGLSSTKETVITAGLGGGEEIAFMRPKESLVKKHVLLPDSVVKVIEGGDEDGGEDFPAGRSKDIPDTAGKDE